MDIVKRILILKNLGKDERVKGSAKITTDGNTLTADFELVNALNLTFETMTAIIATKDGVFYKTFNRATIFSSQFATNCSIDEGVSILVVSQDEFLLLYGESGKAFKGFDELFYLYENESEIKIKSDYNACYDDEKIATENYYEKELSNGLLTKNDTFTADYFRKETPKEIEDKILQNETDDCKCKIAEFYIKNQSAISNILSSYDAFYGFKNLIPESQFVKIDYSQTKHYIFGIIKEFDTPKYVCYGVPGVYGETPNSLKENGKFIPLETGEPIKRGYFVIFQSADTGEIV